jgi:carbon storage regulator CsrA
MLVLSRKKGETIVLLHRKTGESIEVKPTEIRPQVVRIGIKADQHWEIIRSELIDEYAAKAA